MFSWLREYDFENFHCREIVFFHDFILIVLAFTLVFILISLYSVFTNPKFSALYNEGLEIETLWTVVPILILVFIFYPSIKLLKMGSGVGKDGKVIKIIGHQWYWEYRFLVENEALRYGSYPVNTSDLDDEGSFMRCLYTSEVLLLKRESVKELNVSSEDVIHSFSLPSLGIKIDAVPGRINNSVVDGLRKRFRLVSGQCSEICGVLHSKMPIWTFIFPYSHVV